MWHIIECPLFNEIAIVVPCLPNDFVFGDGISRLCYWRLFPLPVEALLSIALFYDVVCKAYHDVRHRRFTRDRLLGVARARLQQLARRDPRVRAVIGRL